MVSVNQSCCTGLPHAADVVMGTTATPPVLPDDWPASVTTRAMTDDDLPVVREIYAQGIATRNATFETEPPSIAQLRDEVAARAPLGGRRLEAPSGGVDGDQPGLRPGLLRRCRRDLASTSPRTSAARAWARR